MRPMTLVVMTGALLLSVGCSNKATENCVAMIECDNALAEATTDYNTAYPDGLDDPAYGNGGSCYKADADVCDAACASSFESYQGAAESYVASGTIDAVPEACQSTDSGTDTDDAS